MPRILLWGWTVFAFGGAGVAFADGGELLAGGLVLVVAVLVTAWGPE